MSVDFAIAAAGILLMGGAFSNKLSSKFNLPTLLLFLCVGMVADLFVPMYGAEDAGKVNFFGIVAIIYILYSGGLETDVPSVRKVALRGLLLAGPGVAITALFNALGTYMIFGMQKSFMWCMLLGAIISSTDAAAVFSILRGKGVALKGDLKPLLEFESGSNDPMAAMLTMVVIGYFSGNANPLFLEVPRVIYQLAGGILSGMFFGWAGRHCFQIKLEFEGLYFVVSVAMVLVCYGISQLLKVNGFMACYVCGLSMAQAHYNYKIGLRKFHNGFAWLMQVGMFILLGALAEPMSLFDVNIWSRGVALGLFLIFISRPAAVWLCLLFSRYTFAEKCFISWGGIRGAAPIVLATFPLAAGVPEAELMFRLIFFMVLLSVVIQGGLLMPAARLLKLAKPGPEPREPAPLELEITRHNRNQELQEFHVHANNELVGRSLAEISLPAGVLVTMIRRGKSFIAPRGDTVVQVDDGMLIIGERPLLAEVRQKYFKVSD